MNQEQLRTIFRSAIELEGEARERYVARACADDAELEGQVRRLLRGAEADTESLRPSADALGSGPPAIRGYRLGDCLGQGGMGTVYRAQELASGDTVAIKVLHAWLRPSPRSMERFRREGEIGASVRSAHVVRTRRFVEAEGGAPCIVMDFSEGQTLRELLDDLKRVPESLLREIARQIAAGLKSIHAAGILHRDLKPENVLINDERRVQLMDLGIAKLVNDSIDLTRDGQFVGSLAYAAPEQFDGPDVDPRADLYSLGVMLYELAAGANPFRFDEPLAAIRAHQEVPLPPLHLAEPSISPFFSQVVDTLASKVPKDRFRSAAALLDVLAEGEESDWWRRASRRSAPRPGAAALEAALPAAGAAMVGRAPECRRLQALWERARDGEGVAVLIRGESGSGKTRLVHDWATELPDEGMHLLYGSFPPEGGAQALVDAIRSRFGSRDLDRKLARFLPSPTLRGALAARVGDTVAPGDAGPDIFASALVHLLRGLAEDAPVLWIVDDLHFATDEAQAAVLAMARAARACRAMLVLTSRPGDHDAATKLRLSGERPETLDLARLDRDDVAELLASLLGEAAIAQQLADVVHEKSAGIPYFVLQIVPALEAQGIVARDAEGRPRLAGHSGDLETPAALSEFVADRIGALEAPHRRVLDAAAICGLEFEAELVAEIVGLPLIGVLQDLAEVERREGIVRSRGRRFRFDHHVVHESLAAGVPERLREELHARAGDVIAAQAGADAAPPEAFRIVRHHLQGNHPERALPFLDRALEYAAGRGDVGADICQRALSIEGLLEDERRFEILGALSKLIGPQGRTQAEIEATTEALEIAERLGDDRLVARALVDAWRSRRNQPGQGAGDESTLRRARELAVRCGDRLTEARACGNLAMLLWGRGEGEESDELMEYAIEQFEALGRRDMVATVLMGKTAHLRRLGRLEDALRGQQEAIRIAEESGFARVLPYAHGNYALTLRDLGRFRESLEQLRIQTDLAERYGDFQNEVYAVANRGGVELSLGRAGDALRSFRHARDLAAVCGDVRTEVTNLSSAALVHMMFGELESADVALRDAEEILKEHDLPIHGTQILIQRGHWIAQSGDREGGIATLRRARERALETGDTHTRFGSLLGLGCMLREAGREAEARAVFEEGRDLARQTDNVQTLLRFDLYLARDPEELAKLRARLEELNPTIDVNTRLELRFVLWEATGEVGDLIESRRLLQKIRAQASPASRDTMIEKSPLYAQVEAAWNQLQ